MKVCFVWIDKFRNFENLGFNLSSSVKFSFDIHSNKLSRKKIEPLPEGFFGESIEDVVGVIGKNGAGKSNAVELICKILKGGKTSLQGNFFVITEEDKKFTCYYSFPDKPEPKANFSIDIVDYNGSINPLKVVFFSNVYDERRNDFDKEVSDISANNLLGRISLYRPDKVTDFEKQIKLIINSKLFRQLNIEVPTKVQFTSKVWMIRNNSSIDRNYFGEDYDKIRDFKRKFRERLRDIKPENKFIHLFRFGFFFEVYQNFLRRNTYNSKETNLFKNFGKVITEIDSLRTTEEITEKILDYLLDEISKTESKQINLFMERFETSKDEDKVEKLRKQIDFIRNLKFTMPKNSIEYHTEGSRNRELEYFSFNFKPNSSKHFISDFVSLFSDIGFFEIKWLGISSGHKAYLNLFASIQHELRKVRQTNLLLCIDEGDLYLHPKWQIEFFDKLLTVLPVIFSGKVQLVLTSHSPFLLSDLPKQCVTILDTEIEGSTKNGVDLKINTFGGNLYDLYSEPFFLANKRMSDFAYNKIKTLIDKVEGGKFSRQERNELQKISDILGDEIIQFRIKKILNND